MPIFLTRNSITPLYKPDGKIHGYSPWRSSQISVTGIPRQIPSGSGVLMYLVAEAGLTNANVRVSDLIISTPPPPEPEPEPTGAVIVLTEADGRVRYFDERLSQN